MKWNIADILKVPRRQKDEGKDRIFVLKSWFKDLYKVMHILI